ncbi:MAG: hypothetical protein WD750_08305 [Gammaproteobacteria bacterium]
MTENKQDLPLRKTRAGQKMETRPLHVEEWLDSLPYIDFNKTSRILEEATRATNLEALKPDVRLELVELYSRPYLYYVDSQIRTGAQHTLHSIETMQAQIDVLKRIAVNLAYAARLATEEALKQKSLWRKSRPPLQAMLFNMNYLSHALVFSFQEYTPAPKNVWKELHFIYDFAADLAQENASLALPAGDTRHKSMSISQAYKRILLATLADPYHLPFGAIWEIHEQLFSWTDLTSIRPFSRVPDPAGHFVINPDSDKPPIPCNKFNQDKGKERYLLLDATALTRLVHDRLAAWSGKPPGDLSSLSPYYAELILKHLSRAWHLPPKRLLPRHQSSGSVSIAYGVNAAHFFFNNEQGFRPPVRAESEEIIAGEPVYDEDQDITPDHNHKVDTWALVDQGTGGIALGREDKPAISIRVGELVAIMPARDRSTWSAGIIRWLMAQRDGTHKIGLEILSDSVQPAAIRAGSGSELDRRYRQCLLVMDESNKQPASVIVAKGLYIRQREMEIVAAGKHRHIHAGELIEASVAFEHFIPE